MQSFDKAMNIAAILINKSPSNQLSISELAKETGYPISTLHRLLKAMEKHRLIEQDEQTKQYKMGAIWLEYGLRLYDSIDHVSHIRPEMEKLMNKIGESVYLYKPMGNESLIIERIDSHVSAIRAYDNIGLRIPLNSGPYNQAILAYMEENERNRMIRALISKEKQKAFHADLIHIRKKGYAIGNYERMEGTKSIAAPIINGYNQVYGAIGILVVEFNLTEDRLQLLISTLSEAAKHISEKLGNRTITNIF